MKKLFFILVCVSICAVGCNQKTTQQENQTQEEVEFADVARCQSCGMPLTEDLYGTNADGTLNSDYCMYCYADGNFTAPDMTMAEMVEQCIPYVVELGMTEEEARQVVEETLASLKRWQVQE
jgi:nitrous oxide reductase accessory protein NosL